MEKQTLVWAHRGASGYEGKSPEDIRSKERGNQE